MLRDNLIMLRNINGYSQEQIAEKVGISRQAYAKWESGTTVPDIEKCQKLAEVYGITLDGLVKTGAAGDPQGRPRALWDRSRAAFYRTQRGPGGNRPRPGRTL